MMMYSVLKKSIHDGDCFAALNDEDDGGGDDNRKVVKLKKVRKIMKKREGDNVDEIEEKN